MKKLNICHIITTTREEAKELRKAYRATSILYKNTISQGNNKQTITLDIRFGRMFIFCPHLIQLLWATALKMSYGDKIYNYLYV